MIKRFLTNQHLTSIMRSVLLIALFLCLIFSFCACNKDNVQADSNKGFTLSGQVKRTDGSTLANVSVLKNGEEFFPSVSTNAQGIFTAYNLEKDDIISFRRHDYTFSPSSYTIQKDCFDLKVHASSTGEGTDTDNPVNPDTSDETQKPTLTLTSNNIALVDDISGSYAQNTVVSLKADEADGWRFDGWYQLDSLSQDGKNLGKNRSTDFTITKSTTIHARYVQVPLKPSEIVWSDTTDTLSWSESTGAASYNIYVENELCFNTENTSLNLAEHLNAGNNNVAVEAVGNTTFDGLVSHKEKCIIFFKNRILSAKNIGFLQNGDEKYFIFTLNFSQEMLNNCYGFAFSFQKDDAVWQGAFSLDSIGHSPSQTDISLSLLENGETIDNYALLFGASRVDNQNINGELCQTIKIKFDEVLTVELPALLNSYYANLDSPETYIQSLSSVSETGDYTFSITATTPKETERNSFPACVTYSHTKQLSAPEFLALDTSQTDNLVLTFADTNQALLNYSPNTFNTLGFELYFNDVKVASICSADCILPLSEQTVSETHSIGLNSSAISPFLPAELSDLNTISIRTIANGYIPSTHSTLVLDL